MTPHPEKERLLKRIRFWMAVFIVSLVISGVTAFPIKWEMDIAMKWVPMFPAFVQTWMQTVHQGVSETWTNYPFIPYGTDWLAFGHIVIALFFFGPYKDPVRNIWVIEAGMIACVLVLPLALIMGAVREIPFWWRLVDCSFGVFGFIMLWWIRSLIVRVGGTGQQVYRS